MGQLVGGDLGDVGQVEGGDLRDVGQVEGGGRREDVGVVLGAGLFEAV